MDVDSQINRIDFLNGVKIGPVHLATRDDYLVCRDIMRAASKNYSFASSFFTMAKLHHVEALYAFLRVGDDRVDVSHHGFESAMQAIDDWEFNYTEAFRTGYSENPVIRAYLNTAVECNIPPETMKNYFRAMREDLTVNRFPRFLDLIHYMEGSAIPVGRAMTYILGVREPFEIRDALPGADSLSIAMQLSNFWRDIGYDWNINRVYLPQEDLEAFRVSETDLSEKRVTSEFIELLEFEFERTERYYEQARQSIPFLATGRWAVWSGLEVYRAILEAIRRNKYDVYNAKAGASKFRKLGIAAKSWTRVAFLR
jgi:phytoene synthase